MEQVHPTRMELMKKRSQIVLEEQGRDLLKEKMEALIQEFFKIMVNFSESREGLEQLAIGGFGEVWLAVVHVGGALAHGLKHNMAGAVTQFAPADVAIFDHYDGVVHVLGLQIVDDDFAVGAKLERQTVCKALVKLNLCGGHGCLPKN